MKKIYLLMIRSFIGPFFAVFFISNVTFVLQLFWLYLDDMIGKGIQVSVIGQLFFYIFLTMVPQSLPIAVMMAAIMCFGSLGESFELVAIKASGVSFFKFMSPLFYLAILISCVSFLFSSYLIPQAHLKRNVLMYSVISSSPAFEIQEGVFFAKIPGNAIRVGKKEQDGPNLENILIIKKMPNAPNEILVAKTGKMLVSPDKRFFNFYLYDGYHYKETGEKLSTKNDFVKIHFTTYIRTFDISAFIPMDLNAESFQRISQTMDIVKLKLQADTNDIRYNTITKERHARMDNVFPIFILDSMSKVKMKTDDVKDAQNYTLYREKMKSNINGILSLAKENATTFKNIIEYQRNYELPVKRESNLFRLDFHNRFSWSVLCMVFFLVGAPLGAITKKGGIGLPLLISIANFVAFFFFSSSLVKSVKQNALNYHIAAWLPVSTFLVIAIVFCYKALNDSNLFDKEIYYRLYYKTIGRFKSEKKK